MRHKGVIIKYNRDRGFGFIKPEMPDYPKESISDILKNNVFFHFRDYKGGIERPAKGEEVSFELKESNAGKPPYAVNITEAAIGSLEDKVELDVVGIVGESEEKSSFQLSEGSYYMVFQKGRNQRPGTLEILYGKCVEERGNCFLIEGYLADVREQDLKNAHLLGISELTSDEMETLIDSSLDHLSKSDLCFKFLANNYRMKDVFDVSPEDYTSFHSEQKSV